MEEHIAFGYKVNYLLVPGLCLRFFQLFPGGSSLLRRHCIHAQKEFRLKESPQGLKLILIYAQTFTQGLKPRPERGQYAPLTA